MSAVNVTHLQGEVEADEGVFINRVRWDDKRQLGDVCWVDPDGNLHFLQVYILHEDSI